MTWECKIIVFSNHASLKYLFTRKDAKARQIRWVLLSLNDALWAYRIVFKTSIEMSPFRLVYRKVCHLLVERDHCAYYSIKKFNFNMQ